MMLKRKKEGKAGKGRPAAPFSPSSTPETDMETHREMHPLMNADAWEEAWRSMASHARKLERQRNIAIAELRRIQNTYGHKSEPGCGCDDCAQIRPIEEALRAAQSPENAEAIHGEKDA